MRALNAALPFDLSNFAPLLPHDVPVPSPADGGLLLLVRRCKKPGLESDAPRDAVHPCKPFLSIDFLIDPKSLSHSASIGYQASYTLIRYITGRKQGRTK